MWPCGSTSRPPYQDVLDFAYYSGWRKREMLELEWRDIDAAGGVVRLSPARSKTRQGRVLPISAPIHQVLTRRRAQRRPEVPRVFHRDGVTVRGWRRAWPRRCCRIDRSGGAFRSGEPSPTDAVGRGPTEFGHPIQHVAREERLGLSSGFRAGSQTRSDDRLVPKDHVLHACLPRVSGGFLPPPTAEYLHASDRPIASTGPRAVPRQRRGSRRRHHDPRVSGAGRSIERDGVVRRVGGHARDVSGYGLDETDAGRRVVARRRGERLRHDDPRAIDPEVSLLPAPLPATAVFRRSPLPLAEHRQPGTVDDEINRSVGRHAIKGDVQWLAPPGQRRVVRRVESGGHQCQDRPQEALRLAQRQAEDEPECQRGLDRMVRKLARPARPTGQPRRPGGHRVRREPQRHVAPLHEGPLIRRPIPNAVSGLVLRVHPRIHRGIVQQLRPTTPAGRESNAARDLHQRPVSGTSTRPSFAEGPQDLAKTEFTLSLIFTRLTISTNMLLYNMDKLRVADELWIATALLHRQYPNRDDFTVREIVQQAEAKRLTGRPLRPGVQAFAYLHGVANKAPNPGRDRILVETSKGRRRLFRPGDPYHPRRGGKGIPRVDKIPAQYAELIHWYRREYVGEIDRGTTDPILSLRGLGKAIWADEEADAYVHRIREGWE